MLTKSIHEVGFSYYTVELEIDILSPKGTQVSVVHENISFPMYKAILSEGIFPSVITFKE